MGDLIWIVGNGNGYAAHGYDGMVQRTKVICKTKYDQLCVQNNMIIALAQCRVPLLILQEW